MAVVPILIDYRRINGLIEEMLLLLQKYLQVGVLWEEAIEEGCPTLSARGACLLRVVAPPLKLGPTPGLAG